MTAAKTLAVLLLASLLWPAAARGADAKIAVVAAENFYGDVAAQIGGDRVAVTSVLNNPDQDPHLFEVSPSIIREVAAARVVVYNGADYDPWIEGLIKVAPRAGRSVIVAADLMHKKSGDNPHLWYDPATMPAVASALAEAFAAADPGHKDDYVARLEAFLASLGPINDKIAAIRGKFADTAVAATEPVFGYMAQALQLQMRNESFQIAVMNDTEPSARDVAAFEHDLRTRRVRVVFYNMQASSELVLHLLDFARVATIPVVGITETAPPGVSYQDWMLNELDATGRALAGPSS